MSQMGVDYLHMLHLGEDYLHIIRLEYHLHIMFDGSRLLIHVMFEGG